MSLKQVPILLLTAGTLVAIAIGCRKGSDVPAPMITLSFEKDTMHLSVGDSVNVRAVVSNSVAVQHSWKLNDSLYSVKFDINIVPKTIGTYVLNYSGGNETSTYTKTITIYVGDRIRPITATSSKYISSVLEYLPAPGQFVNETIADANATQNIIGETNSLISLGGYGGYVVFTFDHSIVNKDGMDLAIAGNPLAPPLEWSEPGIVMVSHDLNGNGIADDEWYELAGSEYESAATKKNYTITYYNPKDTTDVLWKDNLGDSGVVEINNYHNHNYYPLFASNQDSISFTGTLLANTLGMAGSIYVNKGFNLGYADNYSAGDNYTQNRYNSFDISWARDKDGKIVTLPAIDFVKVYTGQNNKGNKVLGEISTEIRGAWDLSMP